MARTSHPSNRPVAARAAVPQIVPGSGNDAAAQLGMDVTRMLLTATLNASKGMLTFIGQMQETQVQAFKAVEQALSSAITEAQSAADLQDLAALPENLLKAGLEGATENFSLALTRCCDAEAKLIEQTQAQAAEMTQKFVGNGSARVSGNGLDQAANAALESLGSAQSAWTQLTQQWVDAVKSSSAK